MIVTETAAGRAAELLADRLNAVMNRTVSDSRLSLISSEADRNAFELTRLVDGNTARGATTRGKEDSYFHVCYGPSGIAWPVLGGLAGRPS